MIASRQIEFPFCRAMGSECSRRFGVLAQVFARKAIPFLGKNGVPAAKQVVANLLEFAAPEKPEFVSGRKSFKTSAKSLGRETLRRSWARLVGRERWPQTGTTGVRHESTQSESFQQKLQSKLVGREKTLSQTFLIAPVKQFYYQPSVVASRSLGGKPEFFSESSKI